MSFFGVCVFGVRLVSVCFEARASLKPAAQQQPAAMPRVVPDQKNKYETDELFKKLSQDVDVKYTGYRDRPVEERRRRFLEDLQEGHSVITFIATGANLNLQFCGSALQDENHPTADRQRTQLTWRASLGRPICAVR
ncbi:Core-binding factor subunit beta [Geodia barretti]|uniref:Core-binding factor subunit beta n=1 Tax=Geodia barretti TaxID=519541 RepID=A0AA35WVU3_GEOBA|nr:Core-binding factor subunit beta [Geodia barretti]